MDSPLASDPHYRAVARTAEPVLVPGYADTPFASTGAQTEPLADPGPDRVQFNGTGTGAGVPAQPEQREEGGHGAPAPATTLPTHTNGTTAPSGGPDRQQRGRRGPRSRSWLALCAVAIAVPLTVWLLPEGGDEDTGDAAASGATTSAKPAASRPGGKEPSGKGSSGKESSDEASSDEGSSGRPPDHIVNDRVSKDRWTLSEDKGQAAFGAGDCDLDSLPDDSPPTGLLSSVSHTTGANTAKVTLRPKDAGRGRGRRRTTSRWGCGPRTRPTVPPGGRSQR